MGFSLLAVYPMIYGVHRWALGTITGRPQGGQEGGVDDGKDAVI
jgi:hypothetical protein